MYIGKNVERSSFFEKQLNSMVVEKKRSGVFEDIALMSMALNQGQIQQQGGSATFRWKH